MKRMNMDVLRVSPLRPLDWRWRYAERVVAGGRRPRRDTLDGPTALAVDFLRGGASRSRQAPHRFAHLRAALELHRAGGDSALAVQARILAGCPATEIAVTAGVPTPVIDLFEQLFFHVADRLDAPDWVTFRAIRQGDWNPARPARAVVLRQLAYFGGPQVLDAVTPLLVGTDAGTPVPERAVPDEARKLVSLLLTPDEPVSNWRLMAMHPMLASPRAGKIPPSKRRSSLGQLLAGLRGAGAERVAQRGGRRGLGEAAKPDLPLPFGAGGGEGPQGVPGVGAGGAEGRRGRQQAASGTAAPQGTRSPRTAASGSGHSGSPSPRKHHPSAGGSRAAGHRAAAAEPTPVEAVA